jgi:hypothetical protein
MAIASSSLAIRAAEPTASQPATQPSLGELDAQIQTMHAQLERLEVQQKQLKRQAEEATTQAEIYKDVAAHHERMGLNGLTAGYKDNRFFIQSDDGNFVIRPWIHLQVRDTTNYREHVVGAGHDGYDTENGIEIRRARFGFDGNLFTPDFTYFFDWATYRQDQSANIVSTGPTPSNPKAPAKGTTIGTINQQIGGLPVLEEAWFQYHFPGTDFSFKGGQLHDPLDHEAMMGSKFRAPEASLQGDIFANTDTFTQAFDVIYDNANNFRVESGINNGIRSNNTSFQDFPNANIGYDWGAAARVEYKVFGNWKDYNQLTSLNDKSDLLVIGAGVDNSEAGKRDEFSHTFDVQYAQTSGLFLYGSYFGRYTRHNNGIATGGPDGASFASAGVIRDTYEPSVMLYGSYLIDKHWEPFARYEYMELKGLPTGSKGNVQEVSGGLNYYFHGHNFKFTGQVMYLPNGIPINDTSSDVLANVKNELIFIAQFQLLL